MPRKSQTQPEAEVLAPLTDLQRQAAALLADGASDERVAAELAVPLPWVQGLQHSLPVAAEVTHRQWRQFQAHGQRVRSLLSRAMDVVEQELDERPTAELAVALLKALKLDAPAVPHRTAQQLLLAECEATAQEVLAAEDLGMGGYSFTTPADVARTARKLYEGEAHRLSAPADPEPVA